MRNIPLHLAKEIVQGYFKFFGAVLFSVEKQQEYVSSHRIRKPTFNRR